MLICCNNFHYIYNFFLKLTDLELGLCNTLSRTFKNKCLGKRYKRKRKTKEKKLLLQKDELTKKT